MKKTLLLLLLFSVFCSKASAQGAIEFNIALSTLTPPLALGINGPLLQPIPSALVTVCAGSSLPSPGSVCSPTTTVYSDIGLSTISINPLNADINGNYFFYGTPGNVYTISVSGSGYMTYSYIWTAPLVSAISSGANTALSNLSTTNINSSLFAQTGLDLGSTTMPFRNLYLYGSGTYGSTYFMDTGTPTGADIQTKQDVSDTYVYRTTTDPLTNKTLNINLNTLLATTNTAGHYLRNNGTQYGDSTIQTTDLPATTSNCSGNSFAQGLNAGGTPVCNAPNPVANTSSLQSATIAGGTSIIHTGVATLATVTVAQPASGCAWRAHAAYSFSWGGGANQSNVSSVVWDGTNQFASANVGSSNGATGGNASNSSYGVTPSVSPYSTGTTAITLTLYAQSTTATDPTTVAGVSFGAPVSAAATFSLEGWGVCQQ